VLGKPAKRGFIGFRGIKFTAAIIQKFRLLPDCTAQPNLCCTACLAQQVRHVRPAEIGPIQPPKIGLCKLGPLLVRCTAQYELLPLVVYGLQLGLLLLVVVVIVVVRPPSQLLYDPQLSPLLYCTSCTTSTTLPTTKSPSSSAKVPLLLLSSMSVLCPDPQPPFITLLLFS
jgi:hypothetical protein